MFSQLLRRIRNRLSRTSGTIVHKFIQHILVPLRPFSRKDGILFIGYVEAGLGLGESLRGMISAAVARKFRFAIYPFRVGVESRIVGQFMPERYDIQHRYDINVIEVAADQLPVVFGSIDPRILEGSYNILRTYWELSKAPPEWSAMLAGIDEIWVPNQFVRGAFKHVFQGPITVIPPCVVVTEECLPDRSRFELDPNRFYFLFSFDYYSSPYRKNPLAVLDAFRQAFPNGDENVGLVIKSTSSEAHHPDIKEKIVREMATDPRIRVFDETFSRKEILGLIRVCDCYVSLHRAEGFGLGMVEAMSFGNVVIGTDYSGSTDFLSDRTGFPIAFDLEPIKNGQYSWAAGQEWASPNLESAVIAFRQAYLDKEGRSDRAQAGRILVTAKYSKVAVGSAMEERINEIGQARINSGG